MASVAALAKRTGEAQQRINDAVAALAGIYNIPVMPLAMHKEPAVRAMMQAENTAAFLESVLANIPRPQVLPEPDDTLIGKRGRKAKAVEATE